MQHLLFASADSSALYNEHNGALVASFNTPRSHPHATAIVPSTPTQGGLIFSTAATKPLLHVYAFQKVRRGLKPIHI
jgi:hypothetical protein